jgi:hypothetical protein
MMKNSLVKRMVSMGIAASLLTAAAVAVAGYKIGWTVVVSKNADGSGYAYGSSGAARNSADGNQEVRCTVTWSSVSCDAWDASNAYIGCQSTDASLIQAARMFGTDSGLQFNVRSDGVCTGIYVYNWSSFAPKVP